MGRSSRKIDAIYEVRAAAEKKALAEKALAEDPGMEKRDQLLEARLTLEEKRSQQSRSATAADTPMARMSRIRINWGGQPGLRLGRARWKLLE
jgi:hypothetical protein